MSSLNFHVRHEVKPDRVWNVLEAVNEGFEYDHITQSDRQLSRLKQLNLVTESGDPTLTEKGEHLYQLGITKPDVLGDILHFLHYTKWSKSDPVTNTMFYTYRAYCDLLHNRRQVELTNGSREEFTAELNGKISTDFDDYTSEWVKGSVSLSVNSLRGVEHWLANMSPAAIEDSTFALRHFCIAELFVLALGFATAQSGSEFGVDQLLTPEKRELIGRICLLDDSDFSQTLDWILPAYPDIVQPGTSAGSYGRFVRVLKIPTIEDIV
jgi:hypothetical protein